MPELPPIPPDLPNELDMWIHIATSGCDAQERAWFRHELASRFQNALAEMVASGMEPAQAIRTLNQFLGEPLTENEGLCKMLRASGADKQRAMHDWVESVFPFTPSAQSPTPSAYLAIWLLHATDGLTPESTNRVRVEITAHYEDALAAAREAGQTEPEAQRMAIAGLGEPKVANRFFRKVYLRTDELKGIERLQKFYRGPRMILLLNVLPLLLVLGLGIRINPPGLKVVDPFLGAYGITLACLLQSLRSWFVLTPPRKNAEKLFIMTSIVLGTLSNMAMIALFRRISLSPPRLFFSQIAGLVAILFLVAYWIGSIHEDLTVYIPLMRKLRENARETSKEGPDQYA